VALANYSDLTSAIADWLNRQDLTARIPDFVTLAEAQFNRQLRVRQMLARSDATLDVQYIALPADNIGLKNVKLLTSPITELSYAEPAYIDEMNRQYTSGKPRFYSIINNTISLAPVPDGAYAGEIQYWQRIPSLAGAATNWLMTLHPDLYLYGSLMQAAPYLKDDDRIQVWAGIVGSLLDDIRLDNERAEKSGNPLKMRIRPF
jgi:hypothetical protein